MRFKPDDAHERLLHDVIRELQSVRAELPGEHRHKPRAFPPEQIPGDFSGAKVLFRRVVVHG